MKKPLLSELTLREKIGQTCVAWIKFSKGDPEYFKKNPYGAVWSSHWMTHDPEVIEEFKAHGYDLGDTKNYEEIYSQWTRDVNKNLRVPLISPLDAEAGQAGNFYNASGTVSQMCYGSANDEELVYKIGQKVAEQSLAGGCHWIWGPVADCPGMFCGGMTLRHYSYDIDQISRLVCAQIKGIQSMGVAATAKHFPGVDRHEYRDAHFQPSLMGYTLEEWEKEQAPSFQAAIDAGVYSVMVGHGAFPAVDDTMVDEAYIPCTLSHKVVTGLLKEKMGFKGVVITDGINMRGLTAVYQGAKLYVELLRAGNDMILGPEADDYIDAVEAAVLSGDLPESRIDDACQRVLDMKEKLGMFREDHVFGGGITQEMRDEMDAVTKEAARKGISLVVDKTNMLPISAEKIKKVGLRFDGYHNVDYILSTFKAAFEKHGAEVIDFQDIPEGIEAAEVFKEKQKDVDLIVYISHIGGHSPMGWPGFSGKEKCDPFYRFILTSGKEKSIGISLAYPFMYYNYYLSCPVFINTFGSGKVSIEECVNGLYGEFEFNRNRTIPIKPEF